jgi:hypothetical protein
MHDRSDSGNYHPVNNGNNLSGFPPANFQNKWSWYWDCQALWFSADSGGAWRVPWLTIKVRALLIMPSILSKSAEARWRTWVN